MPRRRVLVGPVLAVLLVAVAGYAGASAMVYARLADVVPRCGGADQGNTPASFGAPGVDTAPYEVETYERVSFASADGQATIAAWWVPPGSESGAASPAPGGAGAASSERAVIVVHGLNSCRHAPEMLLAAGMLHGAGIGALLIDLRNQGDSSRTDGRYAGGTKEYQDVLGAWNWLRARGIAQAHIGAMGFSLGAGTVMDAMGEEPLLTAAWEDSGFADVDAAISDELARNGYPRFLSVGGLLVAQLLSGSSLTMPNPLWAASRLGTRPVFVTHGTADTRMPVHHATDLAAAIRAHGGNVTVWLVPGAGHVQAIFTRTAEYAARLAAVFTAALR